MKTKKQIEWEMRRVQRNEAEDGASVLLAGYIAALFWVLGTRKRK